MVKLSQHVQEVIDYVAEYATSTNNWLTVKKEILWLLSVKERSEFSRRHYSTKKHSLNDFEKQIIIYWKTSTGVDLTIPDNLLHNPSWVRHRRGWGLKRFNKERQENVIRREKREKKTKTAS